MTQNKFLPLLALRDVVLLPGVIMPVSIRRAPSVASVTDALAIAGEDKHILTSTQIDYKVDTPSVKDIYKIGTFAEIIQTVRLSDEVSKIVLQGISAVNLHNIMYDKYFAADYDLIQPPQSIASRSAELEEKTKELVSRFEQYILSTKLISHEILKIVVDQEESKHIPHLIATHVVKDTRQQQKILEEQDVFEKIDLITKAMDFEIGRIKVQKEIDSSVKSQIEKNQREAYLHEQKRAIDKELDGDGGKSDFEELQSKIDKLKLSKEAKEKAQSELKKLKMTSQMSAEYSLIRSYLDTLLGMPWGKKDKKKMNLADAESVLEKEHFGLEKIKERVLEYIAVLERAKKIKGPILCLIGPPGVGKTSLVRSISHALGRKYSKLALGGMRDEAEIRGHRRTYIGSMPGKIINYIKKAGVDNPVILLDEIDKMSSDFRGDPASALLEVLDPEQNKEFGDHYLEVKYPLSDVIFIATANSYSGLPRALIDRMEIIEVSGYTEKDKLEIAKNYLVKKQMKEHSVTPQEFEINDDAIMDIIRYYTSESGVRGLERNISKLVRKALKKILSSKSPPKISISKDNLEEYLGIRKYKFGLAETSSQIGCTTGLAYTSVGGDLLSIEAATFPGKGEVKTTGKLGEVMTESIHTAYSCFRTRAEKFKLKYENFKDIDIHLHVPEGATPKDGPSAGIAIFTTIMSLMTGVPVKNTVAMTGEVTLRGKVLPIGGLKEKLLAAGRGGIKTVLIPKENEKDLPEIPENVKKKLDIMPVSTVDEVLNYALDQ